MSVAQGISAQDANAYNQQQIQDFKDGKINITKSDLQNLVSSEISQGQQPSGAIMDIIDSYDQIDKNGDGINSSELQAYQNTSKGILGRLGLSSESLALQSNSLGLDLLNSIDSGNDSSSLLPSDSNGLLGNTSTNQTSDNSLTNLMLDNLNTGINNNQSSASSPYLNSLLQSYSSSNPITDSNSMSLVDYLS